MSRAFERLNQFLDQEMRMSHLYQPLMLKALIEGGGRASAREIAWKFLQRDESQLGYYEEITKRMPGRVLAKHGLVERNGSDFWLVPDVTELSPKERVILLRRCEEAVEGYLEKRGERLYAHRQLALGDISGTVRYEVLKRAGYRCELCGTLADERAIEVDHIIPRRHGGTDDRENLQADKSVEGFNIGMNCRGDIADPRGGIRAVIPGKSIWGLGESLASATKADQCQGPPLQFILNQLTSSKLAPRSSASRN